MFELFKQEPTVEIQEESDVIAGAAYTTGVYPMTLKYAYLDESKPNPEKNNPGGAYNINLVFDDSGREFKHTEYISSNKAKDQKTTYTDKGGKEQALPGFTKMDALFRQFTGKGLADQAGDERQINVWDGKANTPQPRKVFSDMMAVPMQLCLIKTLEDKYGKPGETRDGNQIDKFLNEDGLTAPEVAKGETEAKFAKQWAASRTSEYVKDLRKDKSAKGGKPAASTAAKAGSSLFANKSA